MSEGFVVPAGVIEDRVDERVKKQLGKWAKIFVTILGLSGITGVAAVGYILDKAKDVRSALADAEKLVKTAETLRGQVDGYRVDVNKLNDTLAALNESPEGQLGTAVEFLASNPDIQQQLLDVSLMKEGFTNMLSGDEVLFEASKIVLTDNSGARVEITPESIIMSRNGQRRLDIDVSGNAGKVSLVDANDKDRAHMLISDSGSAEVEIVGGTKKQRMRVESDGTPNHEFQ